MSPSDLPSLDAQMQKELPPCAKCGGPHPFDTVIPSVQWNAVIRAAGLPDYLCTTCIVRAFLDAGVSFTMDIDGVPVEVRIDSQDAWDATLISRENTTLRARIRELEIRSRKLEAAGVPSPPPRSEGFDLAVERVAAGICHARAGQGQTCRDKYGVGSWCSACLGHFLLEHVPVSAPSSPSAGWQNIASAPKDGTFVILCVRANDGDYCGRTIGCYIAFDGTPPEGYRDGWCNDTNGRYIEWGTPILWMPLPARPLPPESK